MPSKLTVPALLEKDGISAEVVDLRVINPLRYETILKSVKKTGALCAVDGSWSTCGIAGEIIAGVTERLSVAFLRVPPRRITLPDAPAPTSKPLEAQYYITASQICSAIIDQFNLGATS
jgi:pyruvate dehydrogenase E1 component beta subunit